MTADLEPIDPNAPVSGKILPLVPIDPNAPVSGHVPPPEHPGHLAAEEPEHDWGAASGRIFPLLRPVGTMGLRPEEVTHVTAPGASGHTQPLVGDGPCGLVVVYAMEADGFDVLVNGDHLLSWGVGPTEVNAAAMANLAAWSASAPWTDEVSGERRLLSSDSGARRDAARVLLPEVRAHLADQLAAGARILIGLPERNLLVAGTFHPGDDEFPLLFRDFVVEDSGGADEPIDRRVFELVDGELVEFVPA